MAIFNQPFLSGGFPSMNRAAGAIGGWVELGRTTLGSVGDTITVSSLSDKRYYMVLVNGLPSGNIDGHFRLNGDTGTNYAYRESTDGAADATATSQTIGLINPAFGADDTFGVGYLANRSANEKLAIFHGIRRNTAGAATAPSRRESVSKHAQTSNPISSFTYQNLNSGDFASGSETVVLGWDPADTHTNNFWQELASVTGDGTSTTLSSGTFTAKKYIWAQAYLETTTGNQYSAIRVGNSSLDSGSNYAIRYNINGGADGSGGSQAQMSIQTSSTSQFVNIFAINNASNEKLFSTHTVYQNTAGAANAPNRNEIVGKWANTSNQFNIMGMIQTGGGNYSSASFLKVWGAD